MANDCNVLTAGTIIRSLNCPAQFWGSLKSREKAARDKSRCDSIRGIAYEKIYGSLVEQGDSRETVSQALPIVKVWNIWANFVGNPFEIPIRAPQIDELFRMAKGHRLQQYGIHQAENARGRSDSDCDDG